MLHLKLLGGAVVEDEKGSVSALASRRHPLALLALLATAPSRTLGRGKLVGLLWPESPEKSARNRLGSCLYQARRALGDEAVVTVGDDLRLDTDALACDVCRFDAALAAEEYQSAAELYGGPFLDGFWLRGSPGFERWVDRERDRLRRGFRAALEALAAQAAERGEPEAAAEWWRERANDDPYDARVAQRLMQALAAAGNRAAALRHARVYAHLLEEELGTEPGAEIRELTERLKRAPARASPAAGTGGNGDESEAASEPVRETAAAETASPPETAAMQPASPPDAGDDPAPELPVRSIAVLPFENLSGTEEAAPFTAGLHDDLLTELSRISGLTVISRTSVAVYDGARKPVPEIARELGVGTVVEGGVQSAGGRVRLNVQLIDGGSDAHRWVERYDRELSTESIFEIQTELARKIAGSLHAELAPGEQRGGEGRPTDDLTAYRLAVQGRGFLDQRTEGGMRQAVEYFRRATERDPGYALAWVGLSDALALLNDYAYEEAERVLPKAEKAARRALELEPALAEAHTSLGELHIVRRQGPEAVRELERAVELRPNYAEAHNWLSWVNQCLGRPERALESAQRAVELDPLSPEAMSNLSASHLANREAEKALAEARRERELGSSWGTGQFYEALALYRLGRFTEAKTLLENLSVPWVGPGPLATLALAHAASGDEAAARELITHFERAGDPFSAGLIHLALGENERAFDAFGRVERCADYWPTLAVHQYFPDLFGPLRDDPRYGEMLGAVNRSWGLQADGALSPPA